MNKTDIKVGDIVTYGTSNSQYEVAEIADGTRGGMIGIYDEPPSKHIDWLNPESLTVVENSKPTKPYDSSSDTLAHIRRVQALLMLCVSGLNQRAIDHDTSKLSPEEKELFDVMTPKLKDCTYGTDEYKSFLAQLKPALDHHYAHNSHHPEHYADGINGMSLLDLLEMLCDWKAAGERHTDGSMERSLLVSKERFKISDQLQLILKNTARELGFLNV